MTCARDKSITLTTGERVCGYCPRYLVECEARVLLAMPLDARRAALKARAGKRGSVDELKAAMVRVHAARGAK